MPVHNKTSNKLVIEKNLDKVSTKKLTVHINLSDENRMHFLNDQ